MPSSGLTVVPVGAFLTGIVLGLVGVSGLGVLGWLLVMASVIGVAVLTIFVAWVKYVSTPPWSWQKKGGDTDDKS